MPQTLEQAKNAETQAKRRAFERDIFIPQVADPERRRQLGENDAEWLRHYLPDVFYNPFTDDQLRIIEECGDTLAYGTRQCKAAPRGDGKSSIVKYVMLKKALYREVNFPLVIAATFGKAQKTTASLKRRLQSKAHTSAELAELGKSGKSTAGMTPNLLADDFPLECAVARHVGPWPSRARNVTANGGKPIHIHWGSGDGYFILPTWESEEPLGPIIMSLGWSSDELQGCNVYDVRPDWIMLDDLDSRSSLASEAGSIAEKIEEVIEKTVAGLSGPNQKLGQFMLCTITSEAAAAYKYSDPKLKPAWHGERVRAIRTWPTNKKLWDDYIWKRQKGMQEDDTLGREAHRFYLDNFEEMNAGAVVSNPHNFNETELPDGTALEASNLQRCFNFIADTSLEAFNTEYQNDPPKLDELMQVRVTGYHVSEAAGDMSRGMVAEGVEMVVRGVDVRKIELHQVTLGVEEETPHRICDYGLDSHGTSETTVEQAERLIFTALHNMADGWAAEPIVDVNGIAHRTDLTLIDKGWLGNWTEDGVVKTWATQPVETFCMERGLRNWLPAKGAPNYRAPKADRKTIVGDNWHINRGAGQERRCDEVIWNAAHWHQLAEELFLSSDGRFELFIPGDGVYTHHKAFGDHIVTGATEMRAVLARGSRSRKPRFVRDHWFDSLAMALVAKSINARFNLSMKARVRKTLDQLQAEAAR
ncbi:MAG: hypothetical protein HKN35_15750 [Woeseia sp.]|nr:hypothetical protein [Woeseia sp.]